MIDYRKIPFILSLLLLILSAAWLKAQPTDSLTKSLAKRQAIRSAFLPGWGQWTNGQWYKVIPDGLVLGGGITGIAFTTGPYRDYKEAVQLRFDGDTSTHDAFPGISSAQLLKKERSQRQWFHTAVYGTLYYYAINIFDAYAFAPTNLQQGHSPWKAAWYSLLFPGMGQVYNRKYWKVPIVYAALAGGIYSISWNTRNYYAFSDAYRLRTDGDSTTIDPFANDPVYASTENLLIMTKFYKEYRDLSYIITAGLYALSVIDAIVDAHLYNFDISDDLSLRVRPVLIPSSPEWVPGINLRLNF